MGHDRARARNGAVVQTVSKLHWRGPRLTAPIAAIATFVALSSAAWSCAEPVDPLLGVWRGSVGSLSFSEGGAFAETDQFGAKREGRWARKGEGILELTLGEDRVEARFSIEGNALTLGDGAARYDRSDMPLPGDNPDFDAMIAALDAAVAEYERSANASLTNPADEAALRESISSLKRASELAASLFEYAASLDASQTAKVEALAIRLSTPRP